MRGALIVLVAAVTATGCDALFGLDTIKVPADADAVDGTKRADAAPPVDAACAPSGAVTTTIVGALEGGTGQASMADTFVVSDSNETKNYGAALTLGVCGTGCDAAGDAWDMKTAITLIRFDLSAICPGSTIQGAVLKLTTTNDDLGTNGSVQISEVLEAWDEGNGPDGGTDGAASWTKRTFNTSWTNAGVGTPSSRSSMALTTFLPTTELTQYSVMLPVSVVQNWLDHPAMNFGLAFLVVNGNSDVQFVSREGMPTTARPGLVITAKAP